MSEPRARAERLRESMTLEEKVKQLCAVEASALYDGDGFSEAKADELLSEGIGQLTRIGDETGLPPEDVAEFRNATQEYLQEETRLGVPAIVHDECICGYMGPGGTTYPQGIGLAATFDPETASDVTREIRRQLEAIGTDHALSPVADLARDLRWGRAEETYGEDPYLAAEMTTGYVNGLQGTDNEGVMATLKHFLGHGTTEGGRNRASANIPPRELREEHAFPFEAAIHEADAGAVMNAYHDIDGFPCTSSPDVLRDLLRDELGFEGIVVSDYYSVRFLEDEHNVAESRRDAAVQALEAGIDMELPLIECYDELVGAVEDGDLAEETVNEAVDRVLETKARIGVLDTEPVDPGAVSEAFETDEQREISREAAGKSMTLLENDGTLPLDAPGSIAVVGPMADAGRGMVGDYGYPARTPDHGMDLVSPLEGIEAAFDGDVTHAAGCDMSEDESGIPAAVDAAESADVTVACVGAYSAISLDEGDGVSPQKPTSGEGCDVTDLSLPGAQPALLEAVLDADTTVIPVIVSGRAHTIGWAAEDAAALLHAFLPGEEGGNAVADVLFGDVNPAGRLPVSIPETVGQQPVRYNRKPNSARAGYVDVGIDPAYAFGHGESYTDFSYSDLELSADEIAGRGEITASVTVENTGNVTGDEVVQLYVSDPVASRTRPVQELKGFERISLGAGEEKRVTFTLAADQLAFYDRDMNLTVEAGAFDVRVGAASDDIRAEATFDVTETREVVGERRYLTKTVVDE